jgi:hypothetical protein
MPYAQSYNKFFIQETNVAKNQLIPRNIYKIITYEYADGKVKTLSGTKTSIVFLLGITPDKKLLCIKITQVRPEKFFQWLKKNFKRTVKASDIDSAITESKIDTLLLRDNRVGTKTFSAVKNDSLYKMAPGSYRTYLISGIKRISLMKLDGEYLKKLLNKKDIEQDKEEDNKPEE